MIKECFCFCRYYLLGLALIIPLIFMMYLGYAIYYWALNPASWTVAQRSEIFSSMMGYSLLGGFIFGYALLLCYVKGW